MSVRLKYKNQRQLVENDNTTSTFNDPDPRLSEEKEPELDYVPDKYLVNVNLNEYLPNFRDKRKAVKNSKEVNYWNHKINEQL